MTKKRSRLSGEKKVRIPKVGTSACQGYFLSWAQIGGFYAFVVGITAHLERAGTIAHETLVDTAPDEGERERLIEEWESRVSPIEVLRTHRQFFLEIILVRHVENYLNYLSSLLFEIFTQRPETLKSGQTIDLATVFAHDNMDELVMSVAEKKVESLSYQSFQDLSEYFDEHFGLTLFPQEEMALVIDAVETRNISVHNRCIVNRRYIKRTGAGESLLGTVRQLSIEDLERVIPVLANGVRRLDAEARSKLKISGSRFDIAAVLDRPSGAEDSN